MAHLVTGYAGYAHVKSSDEGAFNASFFGGGQYVMEFGNCFEGSIIDNNTVRILDGDGLMYGRHFRIEPNTHEDMAIQTGTAGTKRIDLICMTYEKNATDETEKCYLQVIKGTETSGTAVVPEYTDGNILEGASFNQMPLYKVTIEGVVLKKIEPIFEAIPTYKALAEYYAGVFQKRCEEIAEEIPLDALTPEDVVDNLESETGRLPLSDKQGKLLNEKIENGAVAWSVSSNVYPTIVDILEQAEEVITKSPNFFHVTSTGASTTGLPNDNYKYSMAIIIKRTLEWGTIMVFNRTTNKIARNTLVNGTWTGWTELSLETDFVYNASTKSLYITG